MGLRLLTLALAVALAVVGCGDVEVLQSVDESDAHRAVTALERVGVSARYEPNGGARRGASFRVRVPRAQVARAVSTLAEEGVPRREQPGFEAAWGDRTLVTTRTEERARAAQAVAGELARTLETLDGVLGARVHVSLPDGPELGREAPPPRPSAAVLLRHAGSSPPCTEAQVRSLVAASIEGMRPDDVAVVFAQRAPRGSTTPPALGRVGPFVVAPASEAPLVVLLVVLSSAAFASALWLLRAIALRRR